MMDVIEEILTRLPVKHVLRCKLLSKSCYHLINNPSFIKKHSLRHHQSDSSSKIIVGRKKYFDDTRLIWTVATLSSSSWSTSSYEFRESEDLPSHTIIAGSCNGLLVLTSGMEDNVNLTVCNPATRKYMSVAKPPPAERHILSMYKDCETAAIGFAYDVKSGDYKVINVARFYRQYIYGGIYYNLIQVWNMRSNSWKQINPVSPLPLCLLSNRRNTFSSCYGLLVNEILYWLAYGKTYIRQFDPCIVSFDPTNDTFGEIALPKDVAQRDFDLHGTELVDFMGSLALSLDRYDDMLFDIWVMGGGSVWTKKFSIGPFPQGVTTSQMCINGNFVLYTGLIYPSLLMEHCKIILYNPHRNEVVTETMVEGLEIHSTDLWSVAESLVSVGEIGC